MTISDVLKTSEFYNNLKVVISDLENTRRKARWMADITAALAHGSNGFAPTR